MAVPRLFPNAVKRLLEREQEKVFEAELQKRFGLRRKGYTPTAVKRSLKRKPKDADHG